MSIKYLYYVSKAKVNALKGQIGSGTRFPKLGIKIGALGFGVEFGFDRENVQNDEAELARDLTAVIKSLRKNKNLLSLQETQDVDTANFYHDSDEWHHGLYSILITESDEETVTYTLWKTDENRIFMLFGSATNILGERQVTAGSELTLASSRTVNKVMESSLQWEFMKVIESCAAADPDELLSFKTDTHQASHLDFMIQHRTQSKLIKAHPDVLQGSALAAFCHSALESLPVSRLETVFKIYHTLPVSRTIAPYNAVYVGSPIFTALE